MLKKSEENGFYLVGLWILFLKRSQNRIFSLKTFTDIQITLQTNVVIRRKGSVNNSEVVTRMH